MSNSPIKVGGRHSNFDKFRGCTPVAEPVMPPEFSVLNQVTLGVEKLYRQCSGKSKGEKLGGKRYRLIDLIAQGGYSVLFRAHDTFRDRDVAVKIMSRGYEYAGLQELAILRKLNNSDVHSVSRVVKVLDAYKDEDSVVLVFELLGGDLLGTIRRGPMSMQNIRKLSIQMLTCLAFLGERGYVHCDLKPENILISSSDDRVGVKLVDFGNAGHISQLQTMYDDYQVQSLCYRAPEVLVGKQFGLEIDMWSLGCILAEAYSGVSPFELEGTGETAQPVFDRLVSIFGWEGIPTPLKDSLFHNDLEADLKKRLNGKPVERMGFVEAILVQCSDFVFTSFIQGFLELDPKKRFTPIQALFHPFLHPVFPFPAIFGSSRLERLTQIIHTPAQAKPARTDEDRRGKLKPKPLFEESTPVDGDEDTEEQRGSEQRREIRARDNSVDQQRTPKSPFVKRERTPKSPFVKRERTPKSSLVKREAGDGDVKAKQRSRSVDKGAVTLPRTPQSAVSSRKMKKKAVITAQGDGDGDGGGDSDDSSIANLISPGRPQQHEQKKEKGRERTPKTPQSEQKSVRKNTQPKAKSEVEQMLSPSPIEKKRKRPSSSSAGSSQEPSDGLKHPPASVQLAPTTPTKPPTTRLPAKPHTTRLPTKRSVNSSSPELKKYRSDTITSPSNSSVHNSPKLSKPSTSSSVKPLPGRVTQVGETKSAVSRPLFRSSPRKGSADDEDGNHSKEQNEMLQDAEEDDGDASSGFKSDDDVVLLPSSM